MMEETLNLFDIETASNGMYKEEKPAASGWETIKNAVGVPKDPYFDRNSGSAWDWLPIMDLPAIMAALGNSSPVNALEFTSPIIFCPCAPQGNTQFVYNVLGSRCPWP